MFMKHPILVLVLIFGLFACSAKNEKHDEQKKEGKTEPVLNQQNCFREYHNAFSDTLRERVISDTNQLILSQFELPTSRKYFQKMESRDSMNVLFSFDFPTKESTLKGWCGTGIEEGFLSIDFEPDSTIVCTRYYTNSCAHYITSTKDSSRIYNTYKVSWNKCDTLILIHDVFNDQVSF